MEADDLIDLFSPLGPVSVKRMFGGKGVWADGVMFALVAYGEVYLKTDAETQEMLADAEPFSFRRGEKVIATSYRRLPPECFDDPDELVRYAGAALEAARRGGAAKPPKTPKARGRRRAAS
ncbi:TfoX/Sxy family protein [Acuticoccus sediminis]|uniref:TfoX/Sxy family protein n=1 Tax=Acuticoccus sediminis TaxID=2184697 RepID=UPI001CFD8BEF|nr:TfoX/Sxy family protein [Acuticoccus sediminis]